MARRNVSSRLVTFASASCWLGSVDGSAQLILSEGSDNLPLHTVVTTLSIAGATPSPILTRRARNASLPIVGWSDLHFDWQENPRAWNGDPNTQ